MAFDIGGTLERSCGCPTCAYQLVAVSVSLIAICAGASHACAFAYARTLHAEAVESECRDIGSLMELLRTTQHLLGEYVGLFHSFQNECMMWRARARVGVNERGSLGRGD